MRGHHPLAENSKRQCDVISRQQALAGGMTSRQIDTRLSSLQWVPLERGIYLTRPGAVASMHRNWAAQLHGGPLAMLTGCHAMALHGVRIPTPPPVTVLVPHFERKNSTSSTHVRRSRELPRPFGEGGLQFAPLARATMDAACLASSLDDIRAVLAASVQQRKTSVAEMIRAAREMYRIPTLVQEGLSEIVAGARSVPEAEMLRRLRRAGMTTLLFNPRVYQGNHFLCSPDVLEEKTWTALEIDSVEFHFSPADYRRTQERRRLAVAAGLIVISATPSEVKRDFTRVLASFQAAIEQGRSRVRPPLLRVG